MVKEKRERLNVIKRARDSYYILFKRWERWEKIIKKQGGGLARHKRKRGRVREGKEPLK